MRLLNPRQITNPINVVQSVSNLVPLITSAATVAASQATQAIVQGIDQGKQVEAIALNMGFRQNCVVMGNLNRCVLSPTLPILVMLLFTQIGLALWTVWRIWQLASCGAKPWWTQCIGSASFELWKVLSCMYLGALAITFATANVVTELRSPVTDATPSTLPGLALAATIALAYVVFVLGTVEVVMDGEPKAGTPVHLTPMGSGGSPGKFTEHIPD